MCVKKVLFAANRGKKETVYETRRRKLLVCIELAPPCVTHGRGEPPHALLIAAVEEVDSFEFGFHACFFLVGHVLEGSAVLSQV